ncbi:hypothetical protein D5R81_17660 [Parashewanella spongiae]|uniref:Dystroglycan-type cadherin-like domain-containing protein n=1 Tax=Parashewanella spongiae TaxID=342950 RepID=A0A3A6T5S3_9GAMM|nr:Ig domain-containing protein [Parashewanella spongiae]MCL1079885.1 Ig domain-containing protein [Parashewanella spongiae]RJY06471.1 hypothetical protein D5R81_17660 [Parashewanella spongiae]
MKINGLLLLLTISGAIAIQGCGGSDDKTEPSSTTPPPPVVQQPKKPELSITGESTLTIPLNQLFTLEFNNTGDAVESCTISPQLPSDLKSQKIGGTCVVLGTPTQAFEATTYTVTGINDVGNSQVEFTMGANHPAPLLASLPAEPFELNDRQQFHLEILTLSDSGFITDCTISPALPSGIGLSMDNGVCSIAGMPTAGSPLTEYTVTATNSGGSDSVSFSIIVNEISQYTGDGPDPFAFDYVAVVSENDKPSTSPVSLRTEIADIDSTLYIQSSGFPNLISQVRTSNNQNFTEPSDIAQLFELFVDPSTGEVEVRLQKQLNFETDAAFYEIDLQLGDDEQTLLVRLYDLQKGTEAEPLTISSYSELVSFAQGHFVSEAIGFDEIQLGGHENSQQQNVDNLFVSLDRDIDATMSKDSLWSAIALHGTINGRHHVIQNLHVDTLGFVNNINNVQNGKIKNIGFDNVKMKSQFISMSKGRIDTLYISGIATPEHATNMRVAPIRAAQDAIRKVYTNIYFDIGHINSLNRLELGSIFSGIASFFFFESAYSNGAVNASIPSNFSTVSIGGLVGFPTFSYSERFRESLFLSAIDFQIQGTGDRLFVGGLAGKHIQYPDGDTTSNDYRWRFVTDRNAPEIIRHVGNYDRDGNNDGMADENTTDTGRDMSGAGISEVQLKQAATFTGKWIEADSHFDITNGEYPVLKGMPYPHTEGASWLTHEDPGIAHQRATYNDYLTKP